MLFWVAIAIGGVIAALAVQAALEWWREPAEARRARKARLAAREAAILAEWRERQRRAADAALDPYNPE